MLTEEQAVTLYESGFWQEMPDRDRALCQLYVEPVCMPFGVFFRSLEKALGRPPMEPAVGRDAMIRELTGREELPSFEEIMALLPAKTRALIEQQDRTATLAERQTTD